MSELPLDLLAEEVAFDDDDDELEDELFEVSDEAGVLDVPLLADLLDEQAAKESKVAEAMSVASIFFFIKIPLLIYP